MNKVFIIGGRSYNVSDPTMRNLSLAGRLIKEEQKKDYDILNEPPGMTMRVSPTSSTGCPRKRSVRFCRPLFREILPWRAICSLERNMSL